ncbi:hypothetical protein HYH03_018819 [Edaphochlamys debaryana]|uniref:Uncharacterized protein n=1 Tax=Edaphochlamys debaryana TaxID=47281 RepID=A0A835XF97_9CHLO|nr:hypothetical protein HYH03_018819 [Edaphochlamys debaryana]|eukprot:KAG2482235.1 hypothetical protein HYH03_018819 [Edaphochlamys debaryana]
MHRPLQRAPRSGARPHSRRIQRASSVPCSALPRSAAELWSCAVAVSEQALARLGLRRPGPRESAGLDGVQQDQARAAGAPAPASSSAPASAAPTAAPASASAPASVTTPAAAAPSADGATAGGREEAEAGERGGLAAASGGGGGGGGARGVRLEVRVVDSISKVPQAEWDAVVGGGPGGELNPFLMWAFLHALEESGSAAPRTGWLPQHVIVREVPYADGGGVPGEGAASSNGNGNGHNGNGNGNGNGHNGNGNGSAVRGGRLVGCVPMYLKGHSNGEYVFDQSWADAASRLGIRYYPKLQAAVPFTPVTGPRLCVDGGLPPSQRAAVVRAMAQALINAADTLDLSGLHLTFTTAEEWAVLGEMGFQQRLGIQFWWQNEGYASFDAFLGELKQSKRKSIRQERKSVAAAGLDVHRLPGGALRPAHWDRFYDFYTDTVDRKWGNAYLTRDFFQRLGETMPERVLLVAASDRGSDPASAPSALAAAALNLVGSHALFGRNWGAAPGREVRNLHFELCYYQALEEAIARGLPRVEAGAQGEHKLQRGYLPSFTYSCHYLRDPALSGAVGRFLNRERGDIQYTLQVMSLQGSPYKRERTVQALLGKLRAHSSLSSLSSADLASADEGGPMEESAGGGGQGESAGVAQAAVRAEAE